MIIGITGVVGSGKTLFMTYMARQYQKQGYSILSNYRLKLPHTLISGDMIENYADAETPLHDCIILLDEVHIILDSRQSASKKNRLLSYWILQSRKRKTHIFYTTQHFGQAEIRLRRQTDFLIECAPIYNKQGVKSRHLVGIMANINQCLGNDMFRLQKKLIIKHPERIYPLYDTYEIVDFRHSGASLPKKA